MDTLDDLLRRCGIRAHVAVASQSQPATAISASTNYPLTIIFTPAGCLSVSSDSGDTDGICQGDLLIIPRNGHVALHASAPTNLRLHEGYSEQQSDLSMVVVIRVDFDYDGCEKHPLFIGLDSCEIIRRDRLQQAGYDHLLEMIGTQLIAYASSLTSPIQCRLAEIVTLVVLEMLKVQAPESQMFMVAIRDHNLRKSIMAFHGRPGHNWNLDRLAEAAGLSRSTFAKRFTDAVGVTPMRYLTMWRMHLAMVALDAGGRELTTLARDLGYSSTSAFQKAFKRAHGITPSQYETTASRPHAGENTASSQDTCTENSAYPM